VPGQILELFPLPELPTRELEEANLEVNPERLKQIQKNLMVQKSKPVEEEDDDIKRPGELYKRYRTIEELPDNAKAFYEIAGKTIFILYLPVAYGFQPRILV